MSGATEHTAAASKHKEAINSKPSCSKHSLGKGSYPRTKYTARASGISENMNSAGGVDAG